MGPASSSDSGRANLAGESEVVTQAVNSRGSWPAARFRSGRYAASLLLRPGTIRQARNAAPKRRKLDHITSTHLLIYSFTHMLTGQARGPGTHIGGARAP